MRAPLTLAFLGLLAVAPGSTPASRGDTGAEADDLAAGFRNPPASGRPRVWWHWVDGHIAEEGVKQDFEWMRRVGIGGVNQIDVSFEGWGPLFEMGPQGAKSLAYLSPGWRHALRYAAGLADEMGLEFGIDSSAGWGNAGGPWVQPQQAMKKLVWSETWVQGGEPFKGRLAAPPETTGLFQNIPLQELGVHPGADRPMPHYYLPVATLAYRAPDSEVPSASLKAMVTSSAGPIDAARLSDGDLATTQSLPFGEDGNAWIQFSFAQPQRIQAVTAVIGPPLLGFNPLLEGREGGWLEASDDGETFRRIAAIPTRGAAEETVSFPPAIARVFRVVLVRPEPSPFSKAGLAPTPAAHEVAELVLHPAPRVNRFEDKGGYSTLQIASEDDTPPVTPGEAIPRSEIVDLTGRVRPDGSVDWTPPAGRWVVLRFGASLLGRTNHPAPASGTGLEVDKLNPAHVKAYLDAYLGEYEKILGPALIGRHGLQSVTIDSYEAGAQNWTDDMLGQFRRRRGYDALPWLPVLAGRVVENAAASDRFLWDFRKTIGELMADGLYGGFAGYLHDQGLGLYAESHESGRAFIGDGMQVKKTADIPMGAMWAGLTLEIQKVNYDADIRESASVAHIYGKKFVAAESFSDHFNPYGFSPETLKPIADRELAMGLNRFVIANSPHQPDSGPGPGQGMSRYGIWFTRRETWAEEAKPWIDYLTRSSYLLQQGRFVADVAYLYGEDTNVTSLFHEGGPPVPPGYNFDFVDPDALLTEFSVENGGLATRGGMAYRVLALDGSTRRMSLPVLRKIRDLVREGAVVVGARPTATPSRADDEGQFRDLVSEVWGDSPDERSVGKGKVFGNPSLAAALGTLAIPSDVTFTPSSAGELRFVHHALNDGDLYFINNGAAQAVAVEASFRVTGKAPELWRADSGTIEPLSYAVENGRTIVPLRLDPNDAVFVVFRRPAAAKSLVVPAPLTEALATLDGPWDARFPPDLGAPAQVHLAGLGSWTDSADPGVKYFSGTATYRRNVTILQDWLRPGSRVQLDLGRVENVAEVLVNGRSLGVLWKAPFVLDLTRTLHAGDNLIEIKVTNLWPNRLIGDRQPGARRIAFATYDPFRVDSPLLPSGLLGPVRLLRLDP